jgi:hypothetical protein
MLTILVMILVYFLPTIIASQRRHPSFWPIALVNFFFGATFIGWLIVFIWSLSPVRSAERIL